jgi:hypothetical protein
MVLKGDLEESLENQTVPMFFRLHFCLRLPLAVAEESGLILLFEGGAEE